jgi:hypothetical protein
MKWETEGSGKIHPVQPPVCQNRQFQISLKVFRSRKIANYSSLFLNNAIIEVFLAKYGKYVLEK